MPVIPSSKFSRLRRAAGVLTAAVLLCLGLTSAPAGAAVPTAGFPWNMQFYHSGKCIDVPGAVNTNVQLEQYTCVSQTNEYWYIDPVTSDGTVFRIHSASSGKCMNVQGAVYTNGTAIIQYGCGSYSNEYWAAVPIAYDSSTGKDYYLIQSADHPDKCLNIAGASPYNGANLQLYNCGTGSYTNEWIYFY